MADEQLPASFFDNPRKVIIEHKDGRQVAVTPRDFRQAKVLPGDKPGDKDQTYEEAGFKIVGWEGGEEYEEPKARVGASQPEPAKEPGG